MKIAVVTDDTSTVCPHFGRATHYLVFTAEGTRILEREIRPKAGHHTHNHAHDNHQEHNHRHQQMVSAIGDCQVVIVAGMGASATDALRAAGIRPCSTEIRDAIRAVRAFLGGVGMTEPGCRSKSAQ